MKLVREEKRVNGCIESRWMRRTVEATLSSASISQAKIVLRSQNQPELRKPALQSTANTKLTACMEMDVGVEVDELEML